jgi:uncharacterized protein with FMN-binding domain
MKTYSTKLIVSVVAFVAVIGGIFGLVLRQSPAQTVSNPVTVPIDNPVTTVPTDVPVTAPITGKYKDGTYTATASYMSPGGSDDLTVSLTLKNGVVTDSTVTPGAHDGKSSRYQDKFIAGYKNLVIGKSIDTLKLGAVSGASLTPVGFNAAVVKIKTQAQA